MTMQSPALTTRIILPPWLNGLLPVLVAVLVGFAVSGVVAYSVGQSPLTMLRELILGDVAEAGGAPCRQRQFGDVLAVQHDPARGGGAQPHDRLDQFALAVAGDAGDAEDLAFA